jgi:hypothetical protein
MQVSVARGRRGQVTGPRLVVGLVVLLALAGALVAGSALRSRPGPGPALVGESVNTGFGSFTVTHVSTTFVPDTQGPPTAAQHVGANGADQLQVWVRLVNTESDRGVRYSPRLFRLVPEADPAGAEPAAGSTLGSATLRRGSSIDGQVWFDLGGAAAGRYRLEYAAPGAPLVRVELGDLDPTSTPGRDHGEGSPGSGEDGHDHDH